MTVRRNEETDARPLGGLQGEMPSAEVGMMTRSERLDYIAEMAWELRGMAVQAGCGTLTGLLDMAAKEARLRRRG